MAKKPLPIIAVSAALAAAACGGDDYAALWPSLDGSSAPASASDSSSSSVFGGGSASGGFDDFGSTPATASPSSGGFFNAPAASATAPPSSGGFFNAPAPRQGASTGTHVGLRIADLRQELARLQNAIAINRGAYEGLKPRISANAQQYQAHAAPIYARLQVGTTPGNPVLVQQWNEAELRLDLVNDDIDLLNSLGNQVASDASLSAHLLDRARSTYAISGAFEEDHRQLSLLEDEINRTVIDVDRLLSQISTDISRQGNFVAAERANLTALALATKTGSFFESPIRAGAGDGAVLGGGVPLAIIRFDQPNIAYERPLREKVTRALESNPGVSFDLVAVSKRGGSESAARSQAEAVYRSLASMGVATDRVKLSAMSGTSNADEVHVYVR